MNYSRFDDIRDEDDEEDDRFEIALISKWEQKRAAINESFESCNEFDDLKYEQFAIAYQDIVPELSCVFWRDEIGRRRAQELVCSCLMNSLSCWVEAKRWVRASHICDELTKGEHINHFETFRHLTEYQSAKLKLTKLLIDFRSTSLSKTSSTICQERINELQHLIASTRTFPSIEIDTCRMMIDAYTEQLRKTTSAKLATTAPVKQVERLALSQSIIRDSANERSSWYSADVVRFLQVVAKKLKEGSFSEDTLMALAKISIMESAEAKLSILSGKSSSPVRSEAFEALFERLHCSLQDGKSIETNAYLLELHQMLHRQSATKCDWLHYCTYHYRHSVSCRDYKMALLSWLGILMHFTSECRTTFKLWCQLVETHMKFGTKRHFNLAMMLCQHLESFEESPYFQGRYHKCLVNNLNWWHGSCLLALEQPIKALPLIDKSCSELQSIVEILLKNLRMSNYSAISHVESEKITDEQLLDWMLRQQSECDSIQSIVAQDGSQADTAKASLSSTDFIPKFPSKQSLYPRELLTWIQPTLSTILSPFRTISPNSSIHALIVREAGIFAFHLELLSKRSRSLAQCYANNGNLDGSKSVLTSCLATLFKSLEVGFGIKFSTDSSFSTFDISHFQTSATQLCDVDDHQASLRKAVDVIQKNIAECHFSLLELSINSTQESPTMVVKIEECVRICSTVKLRTLEASCYHWLGDIYLRPTGVVAYSKFQCFGSVGIDTDIAESAEKAYAEYLKCARVLVQDIDCIAISKVSALSSVLSSAISFTGGELATIAPASPHITPPSSPSSPNSSGSTFGFNRADDTDSTNSSTFFVRILENDAAIAPFWSLQALCDYLIAAYFRAGVAALAFDVTAAIRAFELGNGASEHINTLTDVILQQYSAWGHKSPLETMFICCSARFKLRLADLHYHLGYAYLHAGSYRYAAAEGQACLESIAAAGSHADTKRIQLAHELCALAAIRSGDQRLAEQQLDSMKSLCVGPTVGSTTEINHVQRELDAFQEGLRQRQAPPAAVARTKPTEKAQPEEPPRSADTVVDSDAERVSLASPRFCWLNQIIKTLIVPVVLLLTPRFLQRYLHLDRFEMRDRKGNIVAPDWNFLFATYFLVFIAIFMLRLGHSIYNSV